MWKSIQSLPSFRLTIIKKRLKTGTPGRFFCSCLKISSIMPACLMGRAPLVTGKWELQNPKPTLRNMNDYSFSFSNKIIVIASAHHETRYCCCTFDFHAEHRPAQL